ncbi:MAG TPA: S41 family peptidase [Planctomycetota bacterium]|nr:S41 family peptidase [Planctomycetota bacterium]
MRTARNPILLLALGSFGLAAVAVLSLALVATRRATAEAEIARLLLVRDVVLNEYVEAIDPDRLTEDAMRGMVESLDGYSRYFSVDEATAVEEETTGRFAGIGVVHQTVDDGFEVAFPQPGSPAERAVLRPGWRILTVDGLPVVGLSSSELSGRIRGPIGSAVRIAVRDGDGAVVERDIVREVIHDSSVGHVAMLDRERGIGGLWVASFTEETAAQFDAAVEELRGQGMRALVVDLRFNTGGVLSSAADIANRFLRAGTIYETRGRRDPFVCVARPERATLAGIPTVVLVNGESASASEVLAGALADHRAAAIVGERTYGKGVVQSLKRFEDSRAYLKITTAFYFTPAGRNLERPREGDPLDERAGGIAPDVLVPLARAQRDVIRDSLSVDYYAVPPAYREAVAAIRTGRSAPRVPDPQLDAAIGLLRGRRPNDRKIAS